MVRNSRRSDDASKLLKKHIANSIYINAKKFLFSVNYLFNLQAFKASYVCLIR